jgi:hypothetical protein
MFISASFILVSLRFNMTIFGCILRWSLFLHFGFFALDGCHRTSKKIYLSKFHSLGIIRNEGFLEGKLLDEAERPRIRRT